MARSSGYISFLTSCCDKKYPNKSSGAREAVQWVCFLHKPGDKGEGERV